MYEMLKVKHYSKHDSINADRSFFMQSISEVELQNLRHLIQFSETDEEKYKSYAEQATDPNVKQFFQKAADSACKNRTTFMEFLK